MWVLAQAQPDSGGGGSSLFGIAAVVSAVGIIVLGLYQQRLASQARQAKTDAASASNAADAAKVEASATRRTAIDAQQVAHLAGSAATALLRQADDRTLELGIVEEFKRTIVALNTQLIDMSTSTNDQLSRSTEALVACERREARSMEAQERMREEIIGLRGDVTSLQRIVAVQASGLVKEPPQADDGS